MTTEHADSAKDVVAWHDASMREPTYLHRQTKRPLVNTMTWTVSTALPVACPCCSRSHQLLSRRVLEKYSLLLSLLTT